MGKILQINMDYLTDVETLSDAFMGLAQPIADVAGLKWKVWLHNPEEKTCGGIYLFKDDASVKGYLDSEIVAGLGTSPMVTNVSVKVFDVMPDHSKVTRAPL
jgi:hypothetical protein